MQKSRITNLSTRFLWVYKEGVLAALIGVLLWFIIRSFYRPSDLLLIAPYTYLIYSYIRINRKVFHVEFDDEFLYLIRKESDVLIPLQNIKDVTLKTMGGLYEIQLYHPEAVGDKIFYKPSLLYPFNFKSKDRIADILRDKIEAAKKRPDVIQKNALMS